MMNTEFITDPSDDTARKPLDTTQEGEIYRAQRSHYTKLVETLYRVVPLYMAIIGLLWAYGIGLAKNDGHPDTFIIFVSAIISAIFAHIIDRYGANMDATLEKINEYERNRSVNRVSFPSIDIDFSSDSRKVFTEYVNTYYKLRSIRSHRAIAAGFLSSSACALAFSILINGRFIITLLTIAFMLFALLLTIALIGILFEKFNKYHNRNKASK